MWSRRTRLTKLAARVALVAPLATGSTRLVVKAPAGAASVTRLRQVARVLQQPGESGYSRSTANQIATDLRRRAAGAVLEARAGRRHLFRRSAGDVRLRQLKQLQQDAEVALKKAREAEATAPRRPAIPASASSSGSSYARPAEAAAATHVGSAIPLLALGALAASGAASKRAAHEALMQHQRRVAVGTGAAGAGLLGLAAYAKSRDK